MARIKIDYGIDLGTTNSAIARMENGESVIKQTKNLMDTLPSCVYFSKNKKGERALRIGMKAKDSVYSDAITALSKNEPPKSVDIWSLSVKWVLTRSIPMRICQRKAIPQKNFLQKS